MSAAHTAAATCGSSMNRATPRWVPSGRSRDAKCAITPTPGARTLTPLPWKTSGPLDSSPGMAYSFLQLAWNAIVTVGLSPVGERLQVPSAFWLTKRFTSFPSRYQRMPSRRS